MAANQLMTITEFGKRIGVSQATAYRIVAAGLVDITPVGLGPKPNVRISEAALERYIERNEIPGRRAA